MCYFLEKKLYIGDFWKKKRRDSNTNIEIIVKKVLLSNIDSNQKIKSIVEKDYSHFDSNTKMKSIVPKMLLSKMIVIQKCGISSKNVTIFTMMFVQHILLYFIVGI